MRSRWVSRSTSAVRAGSSRRGNRRSRRRKRIQRTIAMFSDNAQLTSQLSPSHQVQLVAASPSFSAATTAVLCGCGAKATTTSWSAGGGRSDLARSAGAASGWALAVAMGCSQQKMPLGLLQMGGVTHLSSTTSHRACARCGRSRAMSRLSSKTPPISAASCHVCASSRPSRSLAMFFARLVEPVDQPPQFGQVFGLDAPLLDQVPHQRHRFAAEEPLDQIVDRLANDGPRLDAGGIDAGPPVEPGVHVALGLEPPQVGLHGGKIHLPGGRQGLVDLPYGRFAELPEQPGNLHFALAEGLPRGHPRLPFEYACTRRSLDVQAYLSQGEPTGGVQRGRSRVILTRRHKGKGMTSARTIGLAAWLALELACWAAPPTRPNIVLLIADDLGYGELGCYGGREIPTPNLDALATGGVRFTNGYVTAPFCAASRAGLLTGRYQTRFGFEFNPIGAKNAEPQIGLPASERTIAGRLSDAGFATALIGKWHLGGTAEFHPQRRGFDEFFGFLHEGHYYVPPPWTGVTTWLRRTALPDGGEGRWTSPDGRIVWTTHMGHGEPPYDADNPILRGSQPLDERASLTDAFAREACAFIERQKAQPFFLVVAFNAVHSPLQADDAHLARFAHIPDIHRRIFAALLSHLDDAVGQVIAKLHAVGLDEKTLVVFLSDNGGPTRELTSSNAPLRGGKGELSEGGIRVPCLMSWKGRVPAGATADAPISSLDISATALAAAGVPLDAARLDGVDLLPVLRQPQAELPPRALFWRVGQRHALRRGDWKLIREGGRPWRLYNLVSDIGEMADLAAQQPERVAELAAWWDRWNAEQAEPRWK